MIRKVIAAVLCAAAWLGSTGTAAACDAETIAIIVRYFKKDLAVVTDADRLGMQRALALLHRAGPDTQRILQRLVKDMEGSPLGNVDGVANVRELLVAISTAEDSTQASQWLRSLDRFWDRRQFGLTHADPEGGGATSNIKRVAGGSLDEMFEHAAALAMVDTQRYPVDAFVAFGRRVLLRSGERAEADQLLFFAGRSILSDAKRTSQGNRALGVGNFSDDQIRKWARGLRDADLDDVIIPTNGQPTDPLRLHLAEIFAQENAGAFLDRVSFVFVAVPGF